ncbi:DUF4893 domain-containing protein [Sphingomonas mesophila]|uniref:DUF4893 domain-containing protein n=1 Tax=Sphingomonas mesophila TaxID=2303576 RepID=UPI000E5919AA|nr:DUF4893 domain-containing protein [Sphingomonas mesophila]
MISLSGCATTAPPPPPQVPAPAQQDWRAVATAADRARLREWRKAFAQGLARARAAGHRAEIESEAALLDPDAALGGGPIPNGDYRCRVIKLGAKSQGLLDYIAYPAFRCRVRAERGIQGFAKLTGSQRPVGLIFPGDQLRQVFLGTLALGDETHAMHYGRDSERDLAAYVERIGPNRWRMVFPSPAFESLTDVIELVPAS